MSKATYLVSGKSGLEWLFFSPPPHGASLMVHILTSVLIGPDAPAVGGRGSCSHSAEMGAASPWSGLGGEKWGSGL